MKKIYLLCFLSLCLCFFSCTFVATRDYYVHFYDENNTLITTESELKEFDVSIFDNSNIKAYKDVSVDITEIIRDDKEMYEYMIHFHLGIGNMQYQATNYDQKFKDAREYIGIKIEDKKGRYKPVTIYPLGACSRVQEFEPIVVKLENK